MSGGEPTLEIPSLESFPVLGDPGLLTSHANVLGTTSQLLASRGQRITSINSALSTLWSGASANNSYALSASIAQSFQTAANTLNNAAQLLYDYAGDLGNYQDEVAIADKQSQSWHDQIVAWTAKVNDAKIALSKPQAEVTTTQTNLRHAQQQLHQAHEEFNTWQSRARQIQEDADTRGQTFTTDIEGVTLIPPLMPGAPDGPLLKPPKGPLINNPPLKLPKAPDGPLWQPPKGPLINNPRRKNSRAAQTGP